MALVDLHVHSKYSKHPAQWFLQRIGTRESYTKIEDLYQIAKSRGMTFVTLCDHNTIDGALKLVEHSPLDTFVSVEATAYFPENGCKIHVLVYGLNEQQFQEVDRLRTDIYQLRDYLRQENLAHSVAHATYNVNGRLTFETIEKLILLFDVFEEINGGRNPKNNLIWGQSLLNLSPTDIDRLYDKHRIEPFSDTPWLKGLTGGSDDHAGLFIAQTFTEADATTPAEFIEQIKRKQTIGGGKSSNFKSLAFAIYKIACDFSQSGNGKKQTGPMAFVNSLLFENKKPGLRNRLMMEGMRFRAGKEDNERIMLQFLQGVFSDFVKPGDLSIDEKIERMYENIAAMTDNFFAMIFESLERNFKQGDLSGLVKNVSAALPAIFFSMPFFSTVKHLAHDRDIITRLRAEYIEKYQRTAPKVLWFSDTIKESNAVAEAVRSAANVAHLEGRAIRFVLSESQAAATPDLPPNVLTLPDIYTHVPDFQPDYTLTVPSMLQALETIYQQNPDVVVISTPGPLGIVGVLASKLLGIPCLGILHEDYAEAIRRRSSDDLLFDPVDSVIRWVYSFVTTLYVPSFNMFETLEKRGYEAHNMELLPTPSLQKERPNTAILETPYYVPDTDTPLQWDEIFTVLFGAKVDASASLPPIRMTPAQFDRFEDERKIANLTAL